MVGSSKILTVSYGTFSCTLEGFDESFETMKAIAEYFRDLAADDRYFGAEPPTPDADMLARIAEREIARRVEAREQEGRIVLRAQDNAAAGKALASAFGAAPEQEPGPVATEPPEADAGAAPAQETAPEAEAAPATSGDVADAGMAQAPDTQEPADDAATLDALRPEGLEREGDDPAPETDSRISAPSPEHETGDAGIVGVAAGTDDLSARLDLIRSVVGAPDSYDEDEHAQNLAETGGGEPSVRDAAFEDDDTGEAAPTVTGAEAGPVAAGAGRDTVSASADPAGARGTQDDSLFEDTLAALLADAAPVGAPAWSETGADGAEAGADGAAAGDTPGARVVKVSRADVEAARADGLLGTDDASGEDTVNIFGDAAAALSPEDEAALQRELASLDAELGEGIGPEAETDARIGPEAGAEDVPGHAADGPPPASEPEQATAPADRPETGKRTEVSRIFEETDSQMSDPGSVRRRNTIQHLRAALAATRAEKAAGTELGAKVDAAPYRGDLDAAVRPRRAIPAPDAPRSTRPEEQRPAPLKLVAEQRVDGPRSKVRPRRVTTPPKTGVLEVQDKDFPAFAEESGATDLPDLLEAAAAYLADVEGRSQFSRPMLMGKLREIDEDGFSREEGLRSFGMLLREGKLQKLSGGRFAVTGETEFRGAAQRRAG